MLSPLTIARTSPVLLSIATSEALGGLACRELGVDRRLGLPLQVEVDAQLDLEPAVVGFVLASFGERPWCSSACTTWGSTQLVK